MFYNVARKKKHFEQCEIFSSSCSFRAQLQCEQCNRDS